MTEDGTSEGTDVEVHDSGVLRVVTLDRPTAANALSQRAVDAILEAVTDTSNRDVRALVIRGRGQVFCAGTDLGDLATCSDGDLSLRFLRVGYLLEAVMAAPMATMCCVAGPAVGAGADLAMACDHRIAEPSATFRFPGAAFGLVLGSRRLADITGSAFAHQVISTGRKITAAEALRAGMVTAVVGEGESFDSASEIATAIGRLDPETWQGILAATRGATGPGWGMLDLAMSLARNVSLRERMIEFRERTLRRSNGDPRP